MGGTPRILVIDDNRSIRETLSAILEEEGYVVDTAEDGKEAIKKSNAKFYNLALIDIRLPDMEGTQLLTGLRKTTPPMIKIIVTGYPSLKNAVEGLNRGADAYIIKPVNAENLLNTIKTQLRKQKEAKKYSEEKVKEFIETRVQELEVRNAKNPV